MDVYREKLARLLAEAQLEEFAKGLDLGIELNGPRADGETFTQKAWHRDPNLFPLVLEHGAKLDIAPEKLNEELLHILARTIPDLKYPNGITNLMIAAVQEDPRKLAEYLCIRNPHLTYQDKENETAMSYAIKFHRWANVYLINQLEGYEKEGPPPEYQQWKKNPENYLHLPKIKEMNQRAMIQFVRRVMALEPKTRVINPDLMQSILLGKKLSLTATTDLFEQNFYGKDVLDLLHFHPNPPVRAQLFSLWLKQMRNIAGLDGPLMLKVLQVNGTPCLLLGESHRVDNRTKQADYLCLEQFYRSLFTLYPACLDFFLETTSYQHHPNLPKITTKQYYVPGQPQNNPLLHLILEYFPCLGIEKKGCTQKYPTTRFHNIEFRRHVNPLYNHSAGLGDLFLYGEDKKTIHESQMKYLRAVFASLLDGDLEEISTAILEFKGVAKDDEEAGLYTPAVLAEKTAYSKMSKQLQALPRKIQKKAREILLDRFDEMWVKNQGSTENVYFDYGLIINDAFTFLRMLKAIYVYQTSLITFYGGAAHTQQLAEFFLQLGNTTEVSQFGVETAEEIVAEIRKTGQYPISEIKLDQPAWNQVVDLIQAANLSTTPCQVNG